MISFPLPAEDFFKVGGALDPDAPSYVTRQADDDLLQAILSGQYCDVLTARQMGKSSLMVRTIRRLQSEGVRTVTIDLTGLGTEVSASEWYFGLVSRFKRQLGLSVDEKSWWSERGQLGPVQRFSDFLRQVVLEEIQEPIVVFIDEIDSTLSLPFTDDFFAAIRAAYNARATDPAYKRITFVLLGVARPSDLIKERTRTPYNIGTSIDLTDFTPEEAQVLLAGLETAYPEQAKPILERVLHWTGGHPYLTQKVCAEVRSGDGRWTDERIDDLMEHLFLTEEARKETNLQFIRDRIRESHERGGMLRIYRRVWAGKRVQDEERSVVKSQLKLTGLVQTTSGGALIVRNRIYAQVFDKQWVKENVPVSPAQRVAIGATAVAAVALVIIAGLIYRQQTLADEVRAELFTTNFLGATSPEVRLDNLAGLFGLDGYEDETRDLFFGLDTSQQLATFEGLGNPEQVGQDVLVVVQGVYQDQRLESSTERDRLLRVMTGVLHQVEGEDVPGAEVTAMEIDYWVAGRERATEGNLTAAVEQYTLALGLNEENVAILFDRGQANTALGEYKDALADLQNVLELDPEREDAVRQVIEQDSGLFTYIGLHRQEYQTVAARFPTLTPTTTPTNTPTPTPTPTPTNTPTPTHTPTPTSTPTPTNTPTNTPTPTPTLLPGHVPGTGTIIGKLVWNEQPLPGVALWLRSVGLTIAVWIETDESGQFVVDNLPPDYYNIGPWKHPIWHGNLYISVEPDTTTIDTLYAYRDLQVIFPPDGSVINNRPTVEWEVYPDAVIYRVGYSVGRPCEPQQAQVGCVISWRQAAVSWVSGTSWTVPQVLDQGVYRFWVYAYNVQQHIIANGDATVTVP